MSASVAFLQPVRLRSNLETGGLMTTRASLARGQGQGPFQGHVRKWQKKWLPVDSRSQNAKLELLKWVATEERATDNPGDRLQHIKPVEAASTPAQPSAPEPPKPPPAIPPSLPSSNNLASATEGDTEGTFARASEAATSEFEVTEMAEDSHRATTEDDMAIEGPPAASPSPMPDPDPMDTEEAQSLQPSAELPHQGDVMRSTPSEAASVPPDPGQQAASAGQHASEALAPAEALQHEGKFIAGQQVTGISAVPEVPSTVPQQQSSEPLHIPQQTEHGAGTGSTLEMPASTDQAMQH
ncbi:hypothetical protein WJX73_007556 [Symbiochloris irregularis]|uniref:Uncharacterized protein n=1 Tax=Symbiochloris irregularis TaxID=706552 RepID=A0AAW1Q007_9CHLO